MDTLNWHTMPPEQVITEAFKGLDRLATLDKTYRDQFATKIKNSPVIGRVFDSLPQFDKTTV